MFVPSPPLDSLHICLLPVPYLSVEFILTILKSSTFLEPPKSFFSVCAATLCASESKTAFNTEHRQ